MRGYARLVDSRVGLTWVWEDCHGVHECDVCGRATG